MAKSAIRIMAFFGRWLAELARQPALMTSLVVGPFLILLAFGTGVRVTPPNPTVAIVADSTWQSGNPLMQAMQKDFHVLTVTPSEDVARQMLLSGRVDAVLVLPSAPDQSFQEGKHAQITVLTNQIDPAQQAYTYTYVLNQVYAVNQQTTQLMVSNAQSAAKDMQTSVGAAKQYTDQVAAGSTPVPDTLTQFKDRLNQADHAITKFEDTPPKLVSSPFTVQVQNAAKLKPTYTSFYAPAVLALLLQHLAVTLGALTMTRIRLLGIMDLLRISPVRPIEMVTGHYLSYTVLSSVAGAVMVALIVYALSVPLLGSLSMLATSLGLLIVSSLGIGFVIATVSTSEQQSAQLAMLVLLASIFFSGLLIPLDQIIWPARIISYLLPATYAIRALQDLMLRGNMPSVTDLTVLSAASVALFFFTVALLRREWRPD